MPQALPCLLPTQLGQRHPWSCYLPQRVTPLTPLLRPSVPPSRYQRSVARALPWEQVPLGMLYPLSRPPLPLPSAQAS